jgi:hypothetical protein
MGFGFAAGNGAEDVKVFNAHGPEFGEMGLEGGKDMIGLGHGGRIAEKQKEVKSGRMMGNIVRIIVVRIIGERRWQNNLGQNDGEKELAREF